MILQNFFYDCKTCGIRYKAATIPEMMYGDLIMRTNTGKKRYTAVVSSKEFDEVATLVDADPQTAQLSENDRADIFQNIFGVACDPASDGSIYNIRQDPICPQCKQANFKRWGAVKPLEYVEEDIKPVTHENWNSLDKVEKEKQIHEAISAYLPLHKEAKEKLFEELRAYEASCRKIKHHWWNRR